METPMTDLQALVEKVMSLPGFPRSAGMTVVRIEKGHVELNLPRRGDLLQFNGFFHGGVIAGLADHAAGGAATTMMQPGKVAVTVEFKINFLAPANGDALVARAQSIQAGGTIGVVKVDVASVKDGVETACALCIATMRAVDMPSAKQS
jgi:uncharacterized protein (TIGR00369 family)